MKIKLLALGFLLLAQVAGAQSVRLGSTPSDNSQSYCADAGANDTYSCNLPSAPTAYVTGAIYQFKANTANTGAATINFNGLGAKTIKKVAGGVTTDLADNDIRVGQIVELTYDGTNMQMQSLLGNAPAGSGNVNAGGTLTADLPVIGAGSTDVAVGTRSGNTTKFVTMDGSSPATNDCAKWDANDNLTTSGAACGGGGSTIYAARVGRTAAQSINNTTVTNLLFDTEGCTGCFDRGGIHDTGSDTDRLTIPAASTCTTGVNVAFATDNDGNFRSVYIYLNGQGGTLLATTGQLQASGSIPFGTGETPVDLVTTFRAAANDYVVAAVYHDAANALNINQGVYTPIFWINCVAE